MMNTKSAHETRITTIKGGGLHSVPHLRGGAVSSGVKDSGNLDIAIVEAEKAVNAAGVFTRNRLAAAPVQLCRNMLASSSQAKCIVVNSGNANAMTGKDGMRHAMQMRELVEKQCGGPTLVLSTGIIGVPLPMEKISRGIDLAVQRLSKDGLVEIEQAILTTDTVPKSSAVEVLLPATRDEPERRVVVGGVAKGSGMIHPNMATMLGIIATNAPVESETLQTILADAVEDSFNSISVDGDTSTNDSVILLAGGEEMSEISARDPRCPVLSRAIHEIARDLARMIVLDGEGASRFAEITVRGAQSKSKAKKIASHICRSSLVKTALAGGDPNWGRILAAAANAGVDFRPEDIELTLAGIEVFSNGAPCKVNALKLNAEFSKRQIAIELTVGKGEGTAQMFTSDLTQRYVEMNSEYTT